MGPTLRHYDSIHEKTDSATPESRPVSVDEQTVSWALSQLKRRREALESVGEYEEAEKVSLHIDKLQTYEEISRREQLRTLHLLQRLCVDDSHKEECVKFQYAWERNVRTFEENAAAMERDLQARQHRELVLYLERVSCDMQPRVPRWSAKLLSLRKQESIHARAKNYRQARKAKELADALEAQEVQEWQKIRDSQIKKKEEVWKQKQKVEMQGLLARIESGRQELLRTREAAREVLLRRYANVKHQLETEQKLTRLKSFPRSRSRLAIRSTAAGL